MSGLLFLKSDDFNVQVSTKGDIVCNIIRGISLVLFYSPKCVFSQRLIPIFKKLPGTIGGCQFGMINVTTENRIVLMSKHTIVPIEYVPLIILYVNGKPFIRYEGDHDEMQIRKFLLDVTNKLQTKEKFCKDKENGDSGNGKTSRRNMPEYCTGYPLYGDEDEFYLEFDQAYGNGKK